MMIKLIFITSLITLALTGSLDNFSINLYKQIARSNNNKNLVISPMSVSLSAGVARYGASGETRSQIDNALNQPEYLRVQNDLKRVLNLESANEIFVSNRFTLKQDFRENVKSLFECEAQTVDFTDSSKTSKIINDWVEKQTHGAIKDLVKSVEPDLAAIIVNAMYFKGAWENPFGYKTEVPKQDFHLSKTKKTQVTYMDAGKKFFYADLNDKKVSLLELPYKNTNIKMVILLPKEIDGLKDLEENLNAADLASMLGKMRNERTVEVQLPRFKIDFETSLSNALKGLGMTKMFSDNAEFYNLVEGVGLKVSEVFQKAVIDVNENGTEAAAATKWRMYPMCSTCGPAYFTANRPFLFLLKNDDYIFFMGRVVDPKYE